MSRAAYTFAMAQRNPAVRAAERRALANLLKGGRRYAAQAAKRVRGFMYKNPQTTAFGAGAAAQVAYSARKGSKRKRMKNGIARGRKIPRRAGGGKPPTTPSSRVIAKYMVADRMTKFKKAKVTAQKVPKSAISHYKEFGAFTANKCMYINHEHWGSIDKLWYGISLGLAKKLLPMAKIYHGKSLADPCIGPRTQSGDIEFQLDDKMVAAVTRLRLVFTSEGTNGSQSRSFTDVDIEDTFPTPNDKYRSMEAIAKSIETVLRAKYTGLDKTWLSEAQFLFSSVGSSGNEFINAMPIYIPNLDDAEICLYVKSLLKFQNVTLADHASTDTDGAQYNKNAIDANPLTGRMYQGKGHYAQIDTELGQSGDKTLDSYFGSVTPSPDLGGITILGHDNAVSASDLGRVAHIPHAKELYGNQTVASGTIRMAAGAMKFHKTSFTMKKSFKAFADITFELGNPNPSRGFGSHTLFGFTTEHRHGEDTIRLGYNRETDVGCHIKHKMIVHPLKTQYTRDSGVTSAINTPTEHPE